MLFCLISCLLNPIIKNARSKYGYVVMPLFPGKHKNNMCRITDGQDG